MATIKLKYRPSTVAGNDGTLFFQIIHHRRVKQYYTGLHISDAEWNAADASVIMPAGTGSERTGYLATVNNSLKDWHSKFNAIISRLDGRGCRYTAQDVVAALGTPLSIAGLVAFTRALIADMKKIGKKSAVRRFDATLNSLLRYTGGNEVAWADISSTFILGYEQFLIKCGLCRNTTSFYMRNLRAIVNRAVEMDFNISHNPFRHVYMGIDKTVKRAVTLEVIRRIRDIDLSGTPSLDFARKVFMFAFYTRGMSFVDIAFLKKSDLHDGVIIYSRRKTRQQLIVKIEPETKKIIRSFGNNDTPNLLPIITDEADAERQYENAYFRINRNIQKVGRMLGLETRLTLYVARHAWASIAQSNNVAVSTISKAMGHDSEKTTAIYLRSLDTASVDRANSTILHLLTNPARRKRK